MHAAIVADQTGCRDLHECARAARCYWPANRNRGEGWEDKKAEGAHDHSRSAVWGSGVVYYLTE
jgi:hypothetical protein